MTLHSTYLKIREFGFKLCIPDLSSSDNWILWDLPPKSPKVHMFKRNWSDFAEVCINFINFHVKSQEASDNPGRLYICGTLHIPWHCKSMHMHTWIFMSPVLCFVHEIYQGTAYMLYAMPWYMEIQYWEHHKKAHGYLNRFCLSLVRYCVHDQNIFWIDSIKYGSWIFK